MLPLFWTDKIPALQQLRIAAHFLRATPADSRCSSAVEKSSQSSFSNQLASSWLKQTCADFVGAFASLPGA
jgi:hypothetical protein